MNLYAGKAFLAALCSAAFDPAGASGVRLASDDGAVAVQLRHHQKPVVEQDGPDAPAFPVKFIALPIYNAAVSPDGSSIAFLDGRRRLLLFRRQVFIDSGHTYWSSALLRLPIELQSCTRLALTDDEEAARLMSLRLVRDGHPRRRVTSHGPASVLLVVQREEHYPWDATCASVSHTVVAIDTRTEESVALEDCSAQQAWRSRRAGCPVLASLMHPDEVVARLSRIMPLEKQRLPVERSVCMLEPPGQMIR